MLPCRVVTWNLWWRFGDWQARFEAIAAVLRDTAPDVVGLQEVWARGSVNAAGLLAKRLGMHWAWVPSPAPERWQRKIGDSSVAGEDPGTPSGRVDTQAECPSTLIGNAVLSRWPVAGVAHADLPAPRSGAPDGRRVLHAALDTPAGRLPFFTTQLSAFPGRSGLRCAQVRRIAAFVATHSPETGLPPVVTGDLNAVPESDEVRLLEGFLTEPAVPDLLLADAWRYARPSDRGITWSRANPHVKATGEPDSRIDYVLVGMPRGAGAAVVESARVVADEPWEGVWASDHAAVVVDLRLGEAAYVGPGVA